MTSSKQLAEAIEDWAEGHPRSTRLYRSALEHRLLVLTALAAVTGWLYSFPAVVSRDLRLFSATGRSLLQLRIGEVYSQAEVQLGPLGLLMFGLNDLFARIAGVRLEPGIAVAVAVGVTLLSVHVIRSMNSELTPPRALPSGYELFFGCVVIIGGICFEATTSAHPTEALIPLLWLFASQQARRGRGVSAGASLAVAGLLKAWGALGLPLLLLAPRRRAAAAGGATQAFLTALAYAPFLLSNTTSTFTFQWLVKPQSPLTFFVEPGTPFGWSWRVVQAGAILAVGAGLILWRQRLVQGWHVCLAMVAVRMLTDPLDYHYYWLSVGVLVLCGLSTLMPVEPSWWRVPYAAGFYLTLLPFFLLEGTSEAWYIAIASIAALAFATCAAATQRQRALA